MVYSSAFVAFPANTCPTEETILGVDVDFHGTGRSKATS